MFKLDLQYMYIKCGDSGFWGATALKNRIFTTCNEFYQDIWILNNVPSFPYVLRSILELFQAEVMRHGNYDVQRPKRSFDDSPDDINDDSKRLTRIRAHDQLSDDDDDDNNMEQD